MFIFSSLRSIVAVAPSMGGSGGGDWRGHIKGIRSYDFVRCESNDSSSIVLDIDANWLDCVLVDNLPLDRNLMQHL